MEERSRRRVRDLVAQLAFEGRSQNETERARISMMAGSDLLRARAGYRSARPTTAILKIQLATHGRSIQRGHFRTFFGCRPKLCQRASVTDEALGGWKQHQSTTLITRHLTDQVRSKVLPGTSFTVFLPHATSQSAKAPPLEQCSSERQSQPAHRTSRSLD
jgi:hypothetical protein